MSDNLIMAEGRGTTTPRSENLFNGGSPHDNRSNHPNSRRGYGDSLTKASPDAPLRIEPYILTPGPWWCCIDTSTGRSFGGRYSPQEVDYIAAHFRDWPPRPIEPAEFGRVAERAIRQAQGFCHIPSDKSDRWVGGAA